MPRPSKTDQELGYIRDLWDEVRTAEDAYGGMFEMYIRPSNRPGVMLHRMTFTPLPAGLPDWMGKQTLEFVYPNVEQSTYCGFLWRKAITLTRQVAEAYTEKRTRPDKEG